MALDLEKIDLGSLGLNEKESDPTRQLRQLPVEAVEDRPPSLLNNASLRPSLLQATRENPDAYAEKVKLSRKSGIPSFAIDGDEQEIMSDLNFEQIDLDSLQENSPGTSKFLSTFDNAAIAHDDVSTLERIEQIITNTTPILSAIKHTNKKAMVDAGQTVGHVGGKIAQGAISTGTGTMKAIGLGYSRPDQELLAIYEGKARGDNVMDLPSKEFLYEPIDSIRALAFGFRDPESQQRIIQEMQVASGDTPQAKAIRRALFNTDQPLEQEQLQAALDQVQAAALDNTLYEMGTNIDNWVAENIYKNPELQNSEGLKAFFANDVSAGFGSVLGFMASAMLTRSVSSRVAPAMGTAESAFVGAALPGSAVNYSAQFDQALAEGASLEEAFDVAGVSKYIGIAEGLPIMDFLARIDRASGGTVKEAIGAMLRQGTEEAIQEGATEIANAITRHSVYDAEGGFMDVVGDTGHASSVGFTVGALLEFLGQIIVPGRNRGPGIEIDSIERDAEELMNRTINEQGVIDQLNEEVGKANLKKRDPESFTKFMQEVQDEGEKSVFIAGKQVAEYLREKSQREISEDPALRLLAEQAGEAESLNADVVVPLEQFATVLSGSEHYDALRPHMRLSPDTLTQTEQEQQVREDLDARIEKLVQAATEDAQQYEEARAIYEDVKDQLVDTGRVAPKYAREMAQLIPAWATAHAVNNNVTVKEAYERAGLLRIEGPMTGRKAALQVPLDPEQVKRRITDAPAPDRRQRAEAPSPAEDQRETERRQDTQRRTRIEEMSAEDQYKAIYTNELTGLNNRRAFDEDVDNAQVVASVDVDSLKAVNDSLGHDAGDQMLMDVGKALNEAAAGRAYHISGDEFYVLGDDAAEVETVLESAREALKKSSISSDRGQMQGIGMTYGIADSKEAADKAMEEGKLAREAAGERTGRGQTPASLTFNDDPMIDEFMDAFAAATEAHPFGSSVELKDRETYQVADLFLYDDGKAGFAIDHNGNLFSVFKHPESTIERAMPIMVSEAIRNNAKMLDAFEGPLTKAYAANGFKEYARVPWDDKYMPPNWDKATMGTPDVVFMEITNAGYQAATTASAQQIQEPERVRRGTRLLAKQSGQDQRNGREEDGSLGGIPRDIPGFNPRFNQQIADVARDYMSRQGLPYNPPATYAPVDPQRAARIADAFEAAEHNPQDPEVAAAYRALVEETIAQYQAAIEAGLKVEFINYQRDGDPYESSPRLAVEDINQNGHMWVFSTKDGFGSSNFNPVDNPLLQETEFTDINGQPMLVNDLFRVVHDYFGHAKEGVGFRAGGEENAWRVHSSMFSPLARKAMTTETRGQNSWVNYGPYGEQNRVANGSETIFADQKITLLPDWVVEEGASDPIHFYQTQRPRTLGMYSNMLNVVLNMKLPQWKLDKNKKKTINNQIATLTEKEESLRAKLRKDDKEFQKGLDELQARPDLKPAELNEYLNRNDGMLEETELKELRKQIRALKAQLEEGPATKGKVIWEKLKAEPIKADELKWIGVEEFLMTDPEAKFTRESVAQFINQNGVNLVEVVGDEAVPDSEDAEMDNWDMVIDDDPTNYEHRVDDFIDELDDISNLAEFDENVYWADVNDLEKRIDKAIAEKRAANEELPDGVLDVVRRLERLDAISEQQLELPYIEARDIATEKKQLRDELFLLMKTQEIVADWLRDVAEEQARIEYLEEPVEIHTNLTTDYIIIGSNDMGYVIRNRMRHDVTTNDIYSLGEAMAIADSDAIEEGVVGDSGEAAQWGAGRYNNLNTPYENYREMKLVLPDIPGYFNEPDHNFPEDNIVAFLRVNDRELKAAVDSDQERNTFFIEELQSDWHQQGEKYGYSPNSRADIPDAPFGDKAWMALGMKRAIIAAVEQGYTSLAWNDAKSVAETWSKRFSDMYIQEYDEKLPAIVKRLTKQDPVHLNFMGEIAGMIPVFSDNFASREDLMEEIKDDFTVVKEDGSLKPGRYITEMAPGEWNVVDSQESDPGYWVIDITPELRDEVMNEGFPLFQDAKGYYDPAQSIIRLTEASDLTTFIHESAHFMYEMELKAGSKLIKDVNDWYKRNAADVATEANGYLNGDSTAPYEQGLVNSFYNQMWQDATGLNEAQVNRIGMVGNAQRGAPEFAMMRAQRVMDGGELFPIIEHLGDVINRMSPMHGYRWGVDEAAGKIERHLPALANPNLKSFHEDNLANSASFNGVPLKEHKAKVDAALKEYADAHAKLDAYNLPQRLARDAAVDLGNQRFSEAAAKYQQLLDLLNDEEAFTEALQETPADDLRSKEAAKFAGFNTSKVWYHGTTVDFDSFDGMTFLTENADEAAAYAGSRNLSRDNALTKELEKYKSVTVENPGRLRTIGIIEDIDTTGEWWATDQGVVRKNKDGTIDIASNLVSDDTTFSLDDGKVDVVEEPNNDYETIIENIKEDAGVKPAAPVITIPVYTKALKLKEVDSLTANLLGERLSKDLPKELVAKKEQLLKDIEAWKEEGYQGISTTTDDPGALMDVGPIKQIIVFDPSRIRSIHADFSIDQSASSNLLAQGQDTEGKEGPITGQDVIRYLDYQTTGDADKDAAIRRATHEHFARGFEKYVMEGKAPSIELQTAFQKIAQWMIEAYRKIFGGLRNVNLDDTMRRVFDRLLATEEQIAAADARSKFEPLFTSAAMAGMTEREYEDYQDRQKTRKEKANKTLRQKVIGQLTRTTKQWWKEEKQDLVQTEMARLKEQEPVHRARDVLRGKDLKIDHATVIEQYGKKQTSKNGVTSVVIPPAMRGMTAKGQEGVSPDEAAAFLGYDSGAEMISELINAPKLKEAADAAAEAMMVERHGDVLNDGTIERLAEEALDNEEKGRLILQELRALTRGTNQRTIDRATMENLAEENIGKLSFREINPGKYRAAELKSAQEAAVEMAAGNRETAARAKTQQAMNFYLGKAAQKARDDITGVVDWAGRYKRKAVREAIAKAGNGYIEQIDRILNRFDLRKSATLKGVDEKNQDINLWANERRDQDGDTLDLHPAVLNELYATHWKNVPVSELRGIRDSVKNIEHVARYSNKIKIGEEEQAFAAFVDDWVAHIRKQPIRHPKVASAADKPGKAREFAQYSMAQMTKIPWMASWLDGGDRVGMSYMALVDRMETAYNEEIELIKEHARPVMDAILSRSKEDIARHNTKIYVPEIKGKAKHTGNLMGYEVLAFALNTGNPSNLRKMLLGEQFADPDDDSTISFDNPTLQAILKHMTKSDWVLVQSIWDGMNELYPKMAEVYREASGTTPPKIEAEPVITPFGEFPGGYYPMKYDVERSERADRNEERQKAQEDSLFTSFGGLGAETTTGVTNERTGFYDPIRLSLDVVPNHFQEVIHYITHYDAVRQTNKLLRNHKVKAAISESLGKHEYAQLIPWLRDIARDGQESSHKVFWEKAFRKLRFGATIGIMGFKATTGIIQVSGLSNSAAEIGAGNLQQGLRAVLGNPDGVKGAWEFAVNNSRVMGHRVRSMDREILTAMNHIDKKKGLTAKAQEVSMMHIAYIQTYLVDLPTWHGAYIKGMKEWGDEQRAYKYADWVIQSVQGSGLTKDLPTIMRNQNESIRIVTMFMTFFSSLWNASRDTGRSVRDGNMSVGNLAAHMMFMWTVPVLFEMIMRGDLFGADDEPEEQLQHFLTNMAMFPIATVPFLRDAATAVIGDFGYDLSPVTQLLKKGLPALKEVAVRTFSDDDITKSQWKNASRLVGASLGIPGVYQVWATGEHLYEVLEEGEDFTVREVLFGPKWDK